MSNQFALCGDCTIRLVDQNGQEFLVCGKVL